MAILNFNQTFLAPLQTDLHAPHIQRTVIVEEGKTLNLSCAATGNPTPRVEWRRDDGRTINVNGIESKWESNIFLEFLFNFLNYSTAFMRCQCKTVQS